MAIEKNVYTDVFIKNEHYDDYQFFIIIRGINKGL